MEGTPQHPGLLSQHPGAPALQSQGAGGLRNVLEGALLTPAPSQSCRSVGTGGLDDEVGLIPARRKGTVELLRAAPALPPLCSLPR